LRPMGPTLTMAGTIPTIGTTTAPGATTDVVGQSRSPDPEVPGFFVARAAFPVQPPESESAGFALGSVAGIFQRGCKILLALASEFFLGRLKAGDPCGD